MKNLAYHIIRLPEEFYKLRNSSIYTLLKEIGYFEFYNQVSELDIVEELSNKPQYITDWLQWSENKRTRTGWYLKQIDNKEYIVGYFPSENYSDLQSYTDRIKACASYIKKEIEDIRLK